MDRSLRVFYSSEGIPFYLATGPPVLSIRNVYLNLGGNRVSRHKGAGTPNGAASLGLQDENLVTRRGD